MLTGPSFTTPTLSGPTLVTPVLLGPSFDTPALAGNNPTALDVLLLERLDVLLELWLLVELDESVLVDDEL